MNAPFYPNHFLDFFLQHSALDSRLGGQLLLFCFEVMYCTERERATSLLFCAPSTDRLAMLDLWGSFREPLAALITGLFASVITYDTKEMPDELRATFHTGISLFALSYQCTMNFWACESGQMPAGDQSGRELQGIPGSLRFPADKPMSSTYPGHCG